MTARRTFPDDMDPACVLACEALCSLSGVETTESCEGHGQQPPTIYFRAQSLAALHPIVRAIDRCYYAYSADRQHCVVHDSYDDWWLLRATESDLIDDRIRFCLTMRDIPADASRVLALLGQNVADAARQIADWEVAAGRAARLQILEIAEGARPAEPKRPMRAFAEGLLWLDRFREAADWPAPKGLRPLSADEVYALAYAKGFFAGQESITGRFVGCEDLSRDEIWRRFAEAIAWSNEPVDCPTVRPAKSKEDA